MKKVILFAFVALLAACSGPTDITLSEMSTNPEKAQKAMEAMSPEDQTALGTYLMSHVMHVDYKMTVKEAIKAGKAEIAQNAKEHAAGPGK